MKRDPSQAGAPAARRWKLGLAACAVALTVASCSTVLSFVHGGEQTNHVYGGTRRLVGSERVQGAYADFWWSLGPVRYVALLIDIPFSLVADTLLLPVTAIWTWAEPEPGFDQDAAEEDPPR